MPDTSYVSFIGKCWEFLKYIFSFFSARKQEEVNKIDTNLQEDYNKIDQDKENGKQDNTADRLNNLFK